MAPGISLPLRPNNQKEPRGIVFDIKRYAVHDGPGIRTAVYLKGCPLSCVWCHNPEGQAMQAEIVQWQSRCIHCGACLAACPAAEGADLTSSECQLCGRCVEACPAGARELTGRWMTVPEVMAEVKKDILFYDESGGGVTFSGGEPLAQPSFLLALLRACKALELHTAVDTTGYAPAETLSAITPYVNLFLYDLKLMDDAAHRHYAGVPNERILVNLRALAAAGKQVAIRVPIIPGVTDGDENLAAIGRFVVALGSVRQVDLLPYHALAQDKYGRLRKEYALAQVQPPSQDRMQLIASRLKSLGLTVTIGG